MKIFLIVFCLLGGLQACLSSKHTKAPSITIFNPALKKDTFRLLEPIVKFRFSTQGIEEFDPDKEAEIQALYKTAMDKILPFRLLTQPLKVDKGIQKKVKQLISSFLENTNDQTRLDKTIFEDLAQLGNRYYACSLVNYLEWYYYRRWTWYTFYDTNLSFALLDTQTQRILFFETNYGTGAKMISELGAWTHWASVLKEIKP